MEERRHFTPVHGWVRGAVVKEGNERREISLGVVVLDDGKEREDGVVDLSVRSAPVTHEGWLARSSPPHAPQ